MIKRSLKTRIREFKEISNEELVKERQGSERKLKKALSKLTDYIKDNEGPFFDSVKAFSRLNTSYKKLEERVADLNYLLSDNQTDISEYKREYQRLMQTAESKNSAYIKKEREKIKKAHMEEISSAPKPKSPYYNRAGYYLNEKTLSPDIYWSAKDR